MRFSIPFLDKEFTVKTSRSGGKGGQNVNKLATRVQLEFNIVTSQLLSEEEKALLLEKLQPKLNSDGAVQVLAQSARSQLENKELAKKKMYALLNKCFVVRKARKATKPGKQAVERRLVAKKKDSEIKQLRQKTWDTE